MSYETFFFFLRTYFLRVVYCYVPVLSSSVLDSKAPRASSRPSSRAGQELEAPVICPPGPHPASVSLMTPFPHIWPPAPLGGGGPILAP